LEEGELISVQWMLREWLRKMRETSLPDCLDDGEEGERWEVDFVSLRL
jgi:hypothetical protein